MALIMRSRHTHTTVVALALLLLCLPVASGEYDRHTLRGSRALGSMGHGAGLKKCRPWMGWNCPPVAGERGPLRDEDGGRVQAGRGHEADANVEVEGQDDQALVVEERQQQVPVVEEDVGKWQLDSQDVTGRSSSVFADGNYDRDIESVAKFWNSRPCNAGWKFPGVEFGTLDWFEKVRTKKFIVEPHIPSFAEFPKWNGKNVLIIGGGLCTNAASFLEAGARVTVIDLSSESFKLCQKNLELRGLTANADLYNGNAEELQAVIPPQKFDLIWSFGVIHHSPRPSVIMEQCRAFMKVGTEVRIMVYSKISFKLFEVMPVLPNVHHCGLHLSSELSIQPMMRIPSAELTIW